MSKEYTRLCPTCLIPICYSSYTGYWNSKKYSKSCKSCSHSGKTFKRQKKIVLSEKHKKAISDSKMGIVFSLAHRQNLSVSLTGRVRSDEVKRKLRVAQCSRFEALGIRPCTDKGSTGWFKKLNDNGFCYEEGYYFKDLGYYADGYDQKHHIWYEYDTPYHNRKNVKKRDLSRQTTIIEHFKLVGNPLRCFIRASVDSQGKVLSETYVNV